MELPEISLTAAYLKVEMGYLGFVEELPGVNSQGRTIAEARENLLRQAALVFSKERNQSAEELNGKSVMREKFLISVRRILSSVR